jgi:hypothetical protein
VHGAHVQADDARGARPVQHGIVQRQVPLPHRPGMHGQHQPLVNLKLAGQPVRILSTTTLHQY